MTVIQPGLFLLMQRFPDNKDVLRHRFLNSKSFQSICKDYQSCSDALAYWAKSNEKMLQIGIENTAYFCRNWNQILLRAWPMGINLVLWRDIFGSPKF